MIDAPSAAVVSSVMPDNNQMVKVEHPTTISRMPSTHNTLFSIEIHLNAFNDFNHETQVVTAQVSVAATVPESALTFTD